MFSKNGQQMKIANPVMTSRDMKHEQTIIYS